MGIVWVRFGYLGADKMKEPLIYKGSCGGRNRTRTCDPIDVNDVLYQLSHATIMEWENRLAIFIAGRSTDSSEGR